MLCNKNNLILNYWSYFCIIVKIVWSRINPLNIKIWTFWFIKCLECEEEALYSTNGWIYSPFWLGFYFMQFFNSWFYFFRKNLNIKEQFIHRILKVYWKMNFKVFSLLLRKINIYIVNLNTKAKVYSMNKIVRIFTFQMIFYNLMRPPGKINIYGVYIVLSNTLND